MLENYREFFSYCIYVNILGFSQFLISIFTIDYVSAWKNTSLKHKLNVNDNKRHFVTASGAFSL